MTLVLILALMCQHLVSFCQDDLKVKNTSQYLGDKQWKWTAFVQTSDENVQKIAHVKYKLPGSTDHRIVNAIGNPTQPFALEETGYGTFPIEVLVSYKDGTQKTSAGRDLRSSTHSKEQFSSKTDLQSEPMFIICQLCIKIH